MIESTNVPTVAETRPKWLRRILILLGSLFALISGSVMTLGWIPFTPDIPPAGLTNGSPGSGGLRRAFPEMKLRKDNPSTPEKEELGRLLYFDPILSGDNTQSCATCHHPDFGFSDERQVSIGVGGAGIGVTRSGGKEVRRNAPTIWNAAYNHKQFWDGRAEDLEDQARFPITSEEEMNQKPEELVEELKKNREYVELFDRAFGGKEGSAVTFDNVTNAVAAFERTIISNNSPFDRYAAGDPNALTAEQRRGLTLFRSLKTRCFECHGFPTFANPDFKVIGVHSMPGAKEDTGRAEVVKEDNYKFAFKVPTLRNVALTSPYMHNGRLQTLEEVLDFYKNGAGHGVGNSLPNIDDKIRKFSLTTQEKKDLIAFLYALTDESKRPEIPARVPSGLPVVGPARPFAKGSMPPLPTIVSTAPSNTPRRNPTKWTVNPGESIQAALDRTIAGDAIEIRPGTYHETLLIDIENITIRGLTENGQRPILDGQNKLTDAVITSGHKFLIENLVIKDYVNNGITVHGASDVTFRNLQVDNTGLYGVYPVECKGVLIENCVVTNIKDAGIYVGQSANIIVRNNECHNNVAGIEIENCVRSVVENNYCHDNTAGILVFLLPNNPSKIGDENVLRKNRSINNNHANFGDPNAIVGKLIPGIGMFIMAADRTQVTENEIRGNDSFGIAVVGLAIAFPKGRTFDVGAVPEGNRIWNNTFAENGRNPSGLVKEAGAFNCDLFWDGSGWDNSFEQPGAKTFPRILPNQAWPDVFRRAYTRGFAWLRDRMM